MLSARSAPSCNGKKGEPGNPITLDGHGAVLDGTDPLDPGQCREVSPGRHAATDLLPFVQEGEPGSPGDPAPGVQAYCFRSILHPNASP